jgi:hypothetical protein
MRNEKLDARKYHWNRWDQDANGVFSFLIGKQLEADHEVFFDAKTFEYNGWDSERNGHGGFSYYGEGAIYSYAAMKLKDGRILFCITSGGAFTDTFHSGERITARYYMLTEL